jgi:hypothetical protein
MALSPDIFPIELLSSKDIGFTTILSWREDTNHTQKITQNFFGGLGKKKKKWVARCHRRHADRLREPDSTTLRYLQIGPEVEKIR